jgi:phosphonate transport system substrate-binding protein
LFIFHVNGKTMFQKLLFICVFCVSGTVFAQNEITMAVSEGSSGGLDHAQANAKYRALADTIGRAAKRKVTIVFAREFSMLEEGIQAKRFDLIFARPSDYPARAMRDQGYRYVVHANPDGQCYVVVKKDSPIKSLDQAKGKRWVFPEEISYMAKFCKAELRDQGINTRLEKIAYTKEQSFVEKYLQANFADVGVVASYSGAGRGWEKRGDRVIHKSIAQPYFPLVAGKNIDAATLGAIQSSLVDLQNQTEGKRILADLGLQRFDASGAEKLSALPAWLEK